MSRFDLSNASDFSRLTQQGLGEAARIIEGRDISQWDIQEASYEGVVFHVFKSKQDWQGAVSRINDVAGRRKVKYQFPYRDGQTTDDLGSRPVSFSMDILIHGIRYMKGFRALMTKFNEPKPGRLVHPVRGEVTVAVEDVQITHQSDQRKAVLLNVTFIEHNFTLGQFISGTDKTVTSKLSKALDVFNKINSTISRIEASNIASQALKNRLNSYLNLFSTQSSEILTDINTSFNDPEAANDFPSLIPSTEGGTRNADGTTTTDTFLTARSPNDPFQNVPVLESTTTTALNSLDIQKKISTSRDNVTTIVSEINQNGMSLEQFDSVIDLRSSVVLMQEAFEAGVQSSNARIVDYTTPRLMSIREVAFENNIDVNRAEEIDLLNPQLQSVNFIPKNTLIKVPRG